MPYSFLLWIVLLFTRFTYYDLILFKFWIKKLIPGFDFIYLDLPVVCRPGHIRLTLVIVNCDCVISLSWLANQTWLRPSQMYVSPLCVHSPCSSLSEYLTSSSRFSFLSFFASTPTLHIYSFVRLFIDTWTLDLSDSALIFMNLTM